MELRTPIEEIIPAEAERGAGLILEYAGRYLFFLAGARYGDDDATFFAGIGGHLEENETWVECVQREAVEEIGTTVELIDSGVFYRISANDKVTCMHLSDWRDPVRPMAMIEIPIPEEASWNKAGIPHSYFVMVYRGKLSEEHWPTPAGLVLASLHKSLTLADLLSCGANLSEKTPTPRNKCVYPFGSARAMALLMEAGEQF